MYHHYTPVPNDIHKFADLVTPLAEFVIQSFSGHIITEITLEQLIAKAYDTIPYVHSVSLNEINQPVIIIEHSRGYVAFAAMAEEIE